MNILNNSTGPSKPTVSAKSLFTWPLALSLDTGIARSWKPSKRAFRFAIREQIMKCRFSDSEEKQIKNLYEYGFGSIRLGRIYNCASRTVRNIVIRQRGTARKQPRERISKICEHCQGEYETILSRKDSRFCCMECKNASHAIEMNGALNSNWQGGEITKQCEWCNEKFTVRRHRERTARFCCQKCMEAWRGKKYSGENHPNWAGGTTPERQQLTNSTRWAKINSKIWKRDNATCQRCGKFAEKRGGAKFHIHHVVPFAQSADLRCSLENLVLVCEDCHHWIHSNENVNGEWLAGRGR